jgi:hypothetical protein
MDIQEPVPHTNGTVDTHPFDGRRAHRIRAVMKSRRKRWTASGDRSQDFLTIRVIVDCDIEESEGQ